MTVSDSERAELSSHYARLLIARATQLGVEREGLLRAVGLSPTLLANPRTRISAAQLGALLRKIWLELDDELSGFGFAAHRFGGFALMARQMIDSTALGEALRYSIRFYNLTSPAIRWRLIEGPRTRLELELLDPAKDRDHFLEEFLLLLWHRFGNWLVGERIPLLQTNFHFQRPPHWREYQLMFPGSLSFEEGATSITFAGEWLEAPAIRSRVDLRRYLSSLPDQWFVKQVFEGSTSERVLRALSEPGDMPSFEALAHRWSLSSRTLHRQLKREGSSFRKLREQLLRDRAVSMLLADKYQVRQIAQALNMSEPAFSRAFKQWTGMSPLAYRRARSI
ncbi:MAG: AraC family transcriptional regulator [Halieaceae bacterium]